MENRLRYEWEHVHYSLPIGSRRAAAEAAGQQPAPAKPKQPAKPRLGKKAPEKQATEEVVSRTDRFAKEKKAKRKHSKNKGKPKR